MNKWWYWNPTILLELAEILHILRVWKPTSHNVSNLQKSYPWNAMLSVSFSWLLQVHHAAVGWYPTYLLQHQERWYHGLDLAGIHAAGSATGLYCQRHSCIWGQFHDQLCASDSVVPDLFPPKWICSLIQSHTYIYCFVSMTRVGLPLTFLANLWTVLFW